MELEARRNWYENGDGEIRFPVGTSSFGRMKAVHVTVFLAGFQFLV